MTLRGLRFNDPDGPLWMFLNALLSSSSFSKPTERSCNIDFAFPLARSGFVQSLHNDLNKEVSPNYSTTVRSITGSPNGLSKFRNILYHPGCYMKILSRRLQLMLEQIEIVHRALHQVVQDALQQEVFPHVIKVPTRVRRVRSKSKKSEKTSKPKTAKAPKTKL